MKRIFKQASVALLGLTVFTAAADEGEIYLADLGNNKPQVLIILDTSAHMKEKADYPYPKYYDPHIAYPHIAYPPIPDTKAENLVYKYLYGGEDFYYNRSSEAKALVHSDLQAIAEKAVNTFSGGPALTSAEQTKYDNFVETIPALGGSQKIDYTSMNCNSALPDFQGDLGAYQDNIGQWLISYLLFYNWANIGSQNIELVRHFVDCQQDITKPDRLNPGYEYDSLLKTDDNNDGQYERESRQGIPSINTPLAHVYWDAYDYGSSATFSDKAYLYSDNLVKWKALKDDDSDTIQLSNLQIAKKVVLDLMLDTTEISTGLEIFNPNNTILEKIDIMDNHGGRVISGISSYDPEDYETEADYKAKVGLLKSKVKDVLTTGFSKSALCESLYEGYRYLYGEGVYFGDDQKLEAKPKRDQSIEDGGNYISPLDWVNSCQTEAYIIMVTTGHHDVSSRATDIVKCGGIFGDLIRIDAHDHDSEANELIEDLEGVTAQDIKDKSVQVNNADTTCDKNLLPVLSDWLANNDMDKTTDVKERIVTYTVGIGELDSGRRNLLEKTAEYGDGEFYNALNANELRQKLEMAFADIIARQQGVTAAVSTSINSSNSTKSNEFVYYTMFQPNQTSKWQGNIRKLKVTDDGQLSAWTQSASAASSLGSTTSAALSTSDTTFFNDSLYSAWSSEQGLNDVELGGVAEALRNRTVDRNIYITNANDSALLPLTKENLKQALAVETDADLANALGVSEDTLAAAIDWLKGKDEAGDFRDDIFGDPMHAQPLVVEYPDDESADVKTKARIFIGTNAGFFHAFKDNGRQVEEEWAFIPKENLATALKLNLQVTRAEERIYGIDSSAVDAEYMVAGKTKHIITFGLRRGGSKYFSLNVNLNPDNSNSTKPELNWVIANTNGFSELAETWSKPVVSKIFRGNDTTNDKPVLIFGGGYDSKKDLCGANDADVPCSDDTGRAIYIIDADAGSIIEEFEYGVITDSIASELAVMDSDGDGYADRIYAPDTAGNIYRVDMPKIFDVDEKKFIMDTLKWRIFKLASLGGTAANDRRFFSAPSIVRAREGASSYDGLLLGSGDITSPNSNITAQNYFFNIKDTNIYPQVWGDDEDAGEREVPATIVLSDLDKITYISSTANDKLKPNDDSDALYGWHYTLNEATVTKEGVTTRGGEKSLGNAVVINGIVHFNTYSPFATDYVIKDGQCVMNQSGNSHYYQVALNSGSTKYYQKLPNVIAKDLAVHAASNGGASILRILGAGKGDTADIEGVQAPTGTIDTEVTLSPRPIYRYFNEAVQ